MKQKINPKICKRNMKLFPLYRALSLDFLFFYTTSFLFLTQIKHISTSAVVLEDSFYAVFVILFQIPAALAVDFLGRRKGMILGNLCNAIYITLILFSNNLFELIFAEIFSALAFSLKDVSDLSLLNSSIPPTTQKSKIFAKITGKGISGYFILNSLSLIISGILFTINGYLPLLISLTIILLSLLLSTLFLEPVETKPEGEAKQLKKYKKKALKDLRNSLENFKDSFKFIIKSPRLRSLIFFSSIMYSFICVLSSYQISLLEELNVSPAIIGIIFATLGMLSAASSKKQDKFHTKFRNKSLALLGFGASLSCLISGFAGYISSNIYITVSIIIFGFTLKHLVVGIYQVLIDKYYRNFTNHKIDSKIFSAKAFFNSIFTALMGIIAAILLEITSTKNALIILGLLFLVLFNFAILYMRKRIGLKPSEYSKEELKFSDIISPNNINLLK